MIKFHCECGKKIGVPEEYAGRTVRCPECQQPTTVPADESSMAEQADPYAQDEHSLLDEPSPLAEELSAMPDSAEVAPAPAGLASPPVVKTGAVYVDQAPGQPGVNEPVSHAAGGVGNLPLGVVGAAIGAGVGAAVWAGVAAGTGYEIGWIAWGLGALAGFGASKLGGQPAASLGIVAVLAAIIGIGAGKVLTIQWAAPAEAARMGAEDTDFVLGAIMYDMAIKGELSPEMKRWVLDLGEGAMPPQDELESIGTHVNQRFDASSESEKKALCRTYAGYIVGQMPMMDMVVESLGPMDALFAFLAIGTAWRIGAGSMNGS